MLAAFNLDQYILDAFVNQLAGYRWFFFIITQLGSPLALAIGACLTFILGKNKLRVFAAILVIGLLFGVMVVDDVKDIVQRPRPAGAEAQLITHGSYSFPSGHALCIFLAAAILGAFFGWRYRLIGYLLAFAVSLSRLYLGVHYPSDVLAGAILGTLMGEILVFAAYRYGLCDNMGLLSCLHKPSITPKKEHIKTNASMDKSGTRSLYIFSFLAALLSIILYYLHYDAIVIFILAIASMLIILYAVIADGRYNARLQIAFVFTSIGLIASQSMYFMGAYAVSLVMIAVAYIVCIAYTYENRKEKKIIT